MKNHSLLRRYLASISGHTSNAPHFIPGLQARAQAGRGSTYKMALAASPKPEEHPCYGAAVTPELDRTKHRSLQNLGPLPKTWLRPLA